MADPTAVAAASIAVGQTVAGYQFFMPRLSDVRKADPNEPDMRGDVLIGQLAASALSIGIGATFTVLTGSKIPLWVSIFTALIIAGAYQYALSQTGHGNAQQA